MYALGDKYDIPNLRLLAKNKFTVMVNTPQTPKETIIKVIARIYECTPETDPYLRELTVLSVRAHMAEIMQGEALKGQLAEVLNTTPEFSMDMLGSFTASPVLVKCTSCGPHQSVRFSAVCGGCNCITSSRLY